MQTVTITQEVIDYVKAHPGAQSQEVFDAIPQADKLGTVQNTLAKLQRIGVLENRGGSANRWTPALWYYVPSHVSDYAQELAHDIYTQMLDQHHSVREQFLAEKLDELFAAPN